MTASQYKNGIMTNKQEVYYQPQGVCVGDIMPYAKDGKFYIYHQRDARINGPITDPFSWSLATTTDFVHYEDFGESLEKGTDEERDQFVYAGSVFEAQGKIHAFYTGYNKNYLKEGKTSQVLLHAESQDFIHWTKSEHALQLKPQPGYDIRNWRDPSVIWDEKKQEYLLILGARKGRDKRKQTGRLVKFTSTDLENWEFKGDFWNPGLYTMFEMPQLFKMGDWWYLIYSEYSDQSKTLYRMSKNVDGPWIKPKDDGFDGKAYYAARTAFDGKRRVLFGWVPTKENDDDLNNYEWGGTFVPHEVFQRSNGTLGVKPIAEICDSFIDKKPLNSVSVGNDDGREEKTLVEKAGTAYYLEASVSFAGDVSDFELRLYKNTETDESYEFRFNIDEKMLTFDKNPCYQWYQYMDKGLKRPLSLKANDEHKLQVIVDDSILTMYIDGIALNARVYNKFGNKIAIAATNGQVKFNNIVFSQRYQS
jgi:beta-fructofuranosidase